MYLIRYQLKISLHNFGKCLENMILKQEQEQGTFLCHLFYPRACFHGTMKYNMYHKTGTKLAYYIRVDET